jgi:hypothetical protein
MTDFSPAAQAVINAFLNAPMGQSHVDDDLIAIAAALRAAADQVVPEFAHDDNDIYGETMLDIRHKLLAIAAELEALPE